MTNPHEEAALDAATAQDALGRLQDWRDGLAWSGGLPRHLWQDLERAAEALVAVLSEIAAPAHGRRSQEGGSHVEAPDGIDEESTAAMRNQKEERP